MASLANQVAAAAAAAAAVHLLCLTNSQEEMELAAAELEAVQSRLLALEAEKANLASRLEANRQEAAASSEVGTQQECLSRMVTEGSYRSVLDGAGVRWSPQYNLWARGGGVGWWVIWGRGYAQCEAFERWRMEG
jgi:hypothetical protein